MRRLAVLDERARVIASGVVAARADWPCRRGCDDCCRSLASPMRIALAEWERIDAALAPAQRAVVAARASDERTCALLDPSSGACLVYEARPVACRAYGFFVGRDGGRWCAAIEAAPALTESVMLGNHDTLERELETLGEPRTLAEWLRG